MSGEIAAYDRLQKSIDELFSNSDPEPGRARTVVEELLGLLESGAVRAAERDPAGDWHAVAWVKRGILLGFRVGNVVDMSLGSATEGSARFSFFDKDTYPSRVFALGDGIRIVPGGSTIRRGAFVARGVVCMPPSYVNVGAYVGAGTMIDSHALVGSCAQIGERVHLSAAAQLGGVLEPINASPVVIEDDVVVGGNCGVYEGTVVQRRAVLASGVVLTRGTPVYDLVNEEIHRASADRPLVIPAGAVVVPGTRPAAGAWAQEHQLSVSTPIIVKYRDERTDAATALEDYLR